MRPSSLLRHEIPLAPMRSSAHRRPMKSQKKGVHHGKMRGEHALPCSPVWKMSPNSVVDIRGKEWRRAGPTSAWPYTNKQSTKRAFYNRERPFRDVQGDQMLAHGPILLCILSTCHHVSGLARLLVPSAVSPLRQVQQHLQPLVQGHRSGVFTLTVKVGSPSWL